MLPVLGLLGVPVFAVGGATSDVASATGMTTTVVLRLLAIFRGLHLPRFTSRWDDPDSAPVVSARPASVDGPASPSPGEGP